MQLRLNINIQKTPMIEKPKDKIVETRRPFVSEIRFMTISPANDPNEKTDWMVSLAHSKSQYKPSSDVIVN